MFIFKSMTETDEKKTLGKQFKGLHIKERVKGERRFNPHGTVRMESLAGVKLAGFKRRFWAYMIDLVILGIALTLFSGVLMMGYIEFFHPKDPLWELSGVRMLADSNDKSAANAPKTDTAAADGDSNEIVLSSNGQLTSPVNNTKRMAFEKASEILQLIFGVLYFGLMVWATNGRTVGKKLMKIRIVSLTQERITLWQSCERALGYSASALEAGFGFFQFFINPNRCCVHDRIAETIVIEDPPREKKAALEEARMEKEVALEEAAEARVIDEEVLGTPKENPQSPQSEP